MANLAACAASRMRTRTFAIFSASLVTLPAFPSLGLAAFYPSCHWGVPMDITELLAFSAKQVRRTCTCAGWPAADDSG